MSPRKDALHVAIERVVISVPNASVELRRIVTRIIDGNATPEDMAAYKAHLIGQMMAGVLRREVMISKLQVAETYAARATARRAPPA